MELSLKTKVIATVVVVATSFAFGRYSVNQTPAVHTIEDIKVDKNIDKDKVTHVVTTITKKVDGSTVTTIDKKTETKTKEKDDITQHLDQTVTPSKQSKINISILGANDFSKGLIVPTYGLSVSKEILGPITAGIYGLKSGVVGISIGIDF